MFLALFCCFIFGRKLKALSAAAGWPVGSCMLMACLVCDFEIKASLILVSAGLKAVSFTNLVEKEANRTKQMQMLTKWRFLATLGKLYARYMLKPCV